MRFLRRSPRVGTLVLYSFVLASALTAPASSVSHAASFVVQPATQARSAQMHDHGSSNATVHGSSFTLQPAFSSATADPIAAVNPQHRRADSRVMSERLTRLLSAAPSASSQPSPSSTPLACAPERRRMSSTFVIAHEQRRRILIAHEQHLRDMGSDQRLLSLVKSLVALGHEVSFFFRSSTPPQLRSPPTEQLARLIGVQRGASHVEVHVRADVRRAPPPAIYEYTSNEQLATLCAQGWFDAVLVFFWFWYDPKPNVAEILLPYVHAFSPKSKRPHITILSDDAHSLRDYRLAEWTADPDLKAGYFASATKHAQRQRVCYMMADKLLHLTEQDSEAEHDLFPFLPREKFGLLRLSPRAFLGAPDASTPQSAATRANESLRAIANGNGDGAPATAAIAVLSRADEKKATQTDELRIGFLGHGGTPTNYLAVRWFLNECWPSLRKLMPGLRLRLVGEPPAGSGPQQPAAIGMSEALPWGITSSAMKTTESDKGGQSARVQKADTAEKGEKSEKGEKGERSKRTTKGGEDIGEGASSKAFVEATASKGSWAAGTPFFGKEEANGIDVLNFLPTETMSSELQSWQAMVVPILSTTGINTKVYLALRLSIPLVISTAAAAPFEFPPDSSAALLASSAAEFISHTHLVASSADVRRNLAMGSAAHWKRLLTSDHSEDDVKTWLAGLCKTAQKTDKSRSDDKSSASGTLRLHSPLTPFEIILRASNGSSTLSTSAPLELGEPQQANGSNSGATATDSKIPMLSPQSCLRTEPNHFPSSVLPPPLIVLVHVISGGEKSIGKRIIGSIFNSVCAVCQLNCVLPIWAGSKATVHVPYETQITLVMLGGRQVAAFDITGARSRNMQARVMHIVVDLDDYLVTKVEIDERQQSWLGMAATQLILQSRTALEREVSVNRTALQLPLIRSECQERSVWRHALRFAGIQDQALQPIWRRLAKDLPNSFGTTTCKEQTLNRTRSSLRTGSAARLRQ